ncbi:HYD1 signature containing ADP-ribosyltransferase family protein [Tenacibaculum maritimum]|uniref:HYD1 signature containing ADP-ribosyltransferase family protein n=1 Tax=Tenacibaculum maritimum TaxID=107401 RepID=UPI001E2DA4CC|nr:HYD1 signature containing ADP-ribosyltransferase family protein [Tenacibaculum maritimum]
MYDEGGEQVWERSLDLNGKVINGSNAPCPFLYQGQYYDKEIELAYNRFRYYDPDDGRYISKDPIGLLSGEYGFYNYVGDSNEELDPYGLEKSTYRVKHFSNKKGIEGIKKDNKIKASDQNKVFTVKAKGRMSKGSSRDIEKKLGIKQGRANKSVEFDVDPSEITIIKNKDTGAIEHVLDGDISLEGRNPIFK